MGPETTRRPHLKLRSEEIEHESLLKKIIPYLVLQGCEVIQTGGASDLANEPFLASRQSQHGS